MKALALVLALTTAALVSLTQISTDPFTNTTSQHQTEVEPDSFAAGSTVVAVTQAGRFTTGGASDIAFATSQNGGGTWSSGVLPGITGFTSPPGPYARVSDPSIAFDPRHGVWLAASLALGASVSGTAVIVNRSTNGGLAWSNPVVVASVGSGQDFDKDWIACDGTATSPFYGSCYVEYDDFGHGNQAHVAYSRDGGLTWHEGSLPSVSVIGGQPVVQPNGRVIMPTADGGATSIISLRSTDGGVSWTGPVTVAAVADHSVAGGLRTSALPSAEADGAGKVYVVWQDCRFRAGCAANDIVLSTSTNGLTWSPVRRVPIGSRTGSADHFIPGIAVDPTTSGAGARLALTYYYYPDTSCSASTCLLDVGYIASGDGGATWSAPIRLARPMRVSWIANTNQGRMVGDYISTSYVGGTARPFFALATAPTGGGACSTASPDCREALDTTTSGLAPTGPTVSSRGEQAVAGFASDHAPPARPIARR